ncbi:hypothetical protein [Streptomyces sp. NPDC003032]
MSDTSLVFNLVARDEASPELAELRAKLGAVGTAAGKLAGVGIALPGLAAAVAGGAALASSAVAAGLAVKAFNAAAGPQLAEVTESWELYSAAQDAAAKGGEAAVEAQKAYEASLADMTPATRDTAKAFIGLKTDFASWSDEMSASTMPVFTKGIGILRDLLPMLTPFVQAAAKAFGGFLDEVAVGVKSAGFKSWAADMSAAAGPALTGFLAIVKNLAVGFAGLLQAFLPTSDGMSGGLVKMSEGFASFGSGLKDSEGFAQFLNMADQGGETLATLGTAAVNLLVAVSPLIGTTATLATGLAQLINAVPTPVLAAFAAALVGAKLGMIGYNLVIGINTGLTAVNAAAIQGNTLALTAYYVRMAAVRTGTALWAAAQWVLNSAIWASPVTWIIVGIVALVAAVVLIATKTTWFQTAWRVAWSGIKSGLWSAWTFMRDRVFLPIGRFFTQTIPGAAGVVRERIVGAFTSAGSQIRSVVSGTISSVRGKFNDFVGFFATLPGRLAKKASGLFSGVRTAFKSAINWVIGKWNNFSFSIGGGSFMGVDVPKVTIGTPNIPYLAKGGLVNRAGMAMVGERGPELLSLPRGAGVTPLSRAGGGGGTITVRIDTSGAYDELLRLFRKMVRVEGGGDVQSAFGRG